jgi:Protein of unknown function (DUF3102)
LASKTDDSWRLREQAAERRAALAQEQRDWQKLTPEQRAQVKAARAGGVPVLPGQALETPAPDPAVQGTVWTREHAREHVMDAYGRSVAFIIETGRRLEHAKTFLPHGQYGPFVRDDLRWSDDKAERYRKIAEVFLQVVESKSAKCRSLPASVSALAALAAAPPEHLAAAIDAGRITPDMTVREAGELASELKELAAPGSLAELAAGQQEEPAQQQAAEEPAEPVQQPQKDAPAPAEVAAPKPVTSPNADEDPPEKSSGETSPPPSSDATCPNCADRDKRIAALEAALAKRDEDFDKAGATIQELRRQLAELETGS